MPTSLSSFPEELLEQILSEALLPIHPTRPEWHPKTNSSSPADVLLVSKLFLRVATPTLYRSIHIRSIEQAHLLARTLLSSPTPLAVHIRQLKMNAVYQPLGQVLPSMTNLLTLDITLDDARSGASIRSPELAVEQARAFCEALPSLKSVRTLKVRKPQTVYLTQIKVRYVLGMIAHAVEGWSNLENAYVLFRMSDDSATRSPFPSLFPLLASLPHSSTPTTTPTSVPTENNHHPQETGPITALTTALSRSPRLKKFSTHLPTLWNTTVLTVSENPALQHIHLSDGSASTRRHVNDDDEEEEEYGEKQAIVGSGMFLMEARKHRRLADLIRLGTPIIRSRAHTMGTISPSPSSSFSSTSKF